jgi:hypothetical protein
MHDESPKPISGAELSSRQSRVEKIARRLGFVGFVVYQHVSTRSGGAQYGMGSSIKQDVLVVYAEAFRRDAAGDDFSLEAIIAHECGHQLLCRYERLRRNTPKEMSAVTEEVLASLAGSLIVGHPGDAEVLILKALFSLAESGMQPAEASRRVEVILGYLEAVL